MKYEYEDKHGKWFAYLDKSEIAALSKADRNAYRIAKDHYKALMLAELEVGEFNILNPITVERLPNDARKKFRAILACKKAAEEVERKAAYDKKISETDALRDSILLSRVVARTVELQPSRFDGYQKLYAKTGFEWRGLCPDHDDTQRSFFVNDRRGFYHCFGCSSHGDIIRWQMRFLGLPYAEAIATTRQEADMLLQETGAVRRQGELAATRGKTIEVYDSWTLAGELKTSHGMNIATRPYSPADNWPPLSRFAYPELKLDWLPAQLTLNMKSVCEAPQVRPRQRHDNGLGMHRIRGSIALSAFGPRMVVATLHGRGDLPSAITMQLRGDRYGLVPGHTEARLVGFIGALPDIRRGLRDLYRFLQHPTWVRTALFNSKLQRNALEPFDCAGMPHSDEARLYAAVWHLQPPETRQGIVRVPSYARPVLKARL